LLKVSIKENNKSHENCQSRFVARNIFDLVMVLGHLLA